MAKYIRLHPENPDPKTVEGIVTALQNGAIIIYPTDTVYGLGCDINNPRAIDRVAQIKGEKAKKANLAIICHDLSHLSDYVKPISNTVFRTLKRLLPGPFTFILPANNNVPKVFNTKKKEVGIRVPNHKIPLAIVAELGHPIVTTSVMGQDELDTYAMDPSIIFEQFKDKVDIVIDGGHANNILSTVVRVDGDSFEIVRQGLGDFSQ